MIKTLTIALFLNATLVLAGSPLRCTTATGLSFQAVYEVSMNDLCNQDYLIINGTTIKAPAKSECSVLESFEGSDGTKLSITSNGLGTLYYQGQVSAVNCEQ